MCMIVCKVCVRAFILTRASKSKSRYSIATGTIPASMTSCVFLSLPRQINENDWSVSCDGRSSVIVRILTESEVFCDYGGCTSRKLAGTGWASIWRASFVSSTNNPLSSILLLGKGPLHKYVTHAISKHA